MEAGCDWRILSDGLKPRLISATQNHTLIPDSTGKRGDAGESHYWVEISDEGLSGWDMHW